MLRNNSYKKYFEDLIKNPKAEFYYSAYFLHFVEKFTDPLTLRNKKYKLYNNSKKFWSTAKALGDSEGCNSKQVYERKDVNSMIFDKVAEKYGTKDKSAFKEYIHIIRNSYTHEEYAGRVAAGCETYKVPKFDMLVNDDCYKELTEIIGVTPDSYLEGLSH
ncbi:MAG: hypothetical protein ACIPMY_03045 [Rickettsia endosymbiont of Pentastiridius leporinus]